MTLGFNGKTVAITDEQLKGLAAARSQAADVSAVLRDLLIDSLGELHLVRHDNVDRKTLTMDGSPDDISSVIFH